MKRYVSQEDRERAITRLTHLARFLDNAIELPGLRYRVGYDAIIGLVPIAGDVVTAATSLYVVYEARRLGVRGGVLALMLLNVGLDFVVGEVPGVGDIIDFFFKSNARNLVLLGRELNLPHLAMVGSGKVSGHVSTQAGGGAADAGGREHAGTSTAWAGEGPRKHVENVAGE